MDEYLKSRYKKGDAKHSAKPMFPVNSKSDIPEPKTEPKPAPPKRQPKPKRRFGLVKILAAVVVLAGLGTGGGYYYFKYAKAPTPLPKKLVKSFDYPVYYPTKLPGSYKYQPGSVNKSGLLEYKIADGSDAVVVTEQKKPKINFDPSVLPGFKPITVNQGIAAIGTSSNAIAIIYVTPTTIINMTAINGISRGDMISIAQNLSTVKQ